MSDIVRGVLGGGWALLVGWIAPTMVNIVLAVWLLSGTGLLPGFAALTGKAPAALTTLACAVLAGLLLAALQTPLYRVLEGYLGWPRFLARRGQKRMLQRKLLLADRIQALRLIERERAGDMEPRDAAALAAMRAHRRVRRHLGRDLAGGPVRRGVLAERLRRFPVDDGQVVATRLGNAIRRLEEFGHDRYRLDSQTFWYELVGVVDERVTRQVEQARTTVNFFVALLYGHVLLAAAVAVTALAGLRPLLWIAALGLPALAYAWYRLAVLATDDWAAAVRAMVNIGRAPLAAALGLTLPETLSDERRMWARQSRLVRLAYDERSDGIDPVRTASPAGQPAPR